MPTSKNIAFNLLLAFVFSTSGASSQELVLHTTDYGFNVGLNLAFGTHVQRLGLNLNFFYLNGDFQANSELRAYINFRNLGPGGTHPELVLAQGLVYGYGKRTSRFNPFINSISNQTGHLYSFSYSYNAYFNNKKTTQQTGLFSIEVNRMSLITENDILARGYFDRFRTAAFLLQYQYEDLWQAAVSCGMWTGQYRKKKENSHPAFYRGCYMDTTAAVHGNLSHGLLSAQFKYHFGYSQTAQANLGLDAEQVRNAMQNKFIHDMRFIPKKWNKANNCHIPMLDEQGEQYLYLENQSIRRAKVYCNFYGNAGVFY